MDEIKFSKILGALLSPDNEVRKVAEAEFEAAKAADSHWVLNALVHIVSHEAATEIHAISLPLLRKMFVKDNQTFDSMSNEAQENIKSSVVIAFTNLCGNKVTQSSVSSLLAALAAKVYYLNRTWDDLWHQMMASMADANASPALRAGSCRVLGSCASVLEPYLRNHHPALAQALALCMQCEDASVRTAASEAIANLVDTIEPKGIAPYRPLLDCILKGVEMSLNASDADAAVTQLVSMSTLIEFSPNILTASSESLLNACMQIASTPDVPAEVRHVAVEVLVVVCENTKIWKKIKSFPINFVDLLFNYSLKPTVNEEWDTTEDSDAAEAEGNSDFDIGVTSLDRVCCSIGPKILAGHVQQLIQNNIGSDSWNHRQAALSVLTYSIEGLKSAFVSHLDVALSMVVSCIEDENKVVRYTAYQCLSQMTTDFAPDLQLNHHQKLMPALLVGLSDPIPRVAGMSVASINSAFDDAENGDDDEMHSANILAPYVEGFCNRLVALFNLTTLLFLRSTILSALSSIIATEKSNMIPFVDLLLPTFHAVLAIPEDPSNLQAIRAYKCRAIECLTLLAGSVKYEHFAQYAHPICEYLVNLMGEKLSNDDPRLAYVLRGWTNMIDCMGERISPYMVSIMPTLFNLANMDCDLEITSADVGDDFADSQEEGVDHMLLNIPGQGDVIVKTKTAQIEDKSTAANILCEFVRILGDQYAPWISETTLSCKNLVNFCANSDIRIIGCEIYGHLIKVVSKVGNEQLPAFCTDVFDVIMSAIKSEKDYSVIGSYLDVLGIIAKECGQSTPEQIFPKLTQLIIEVCKESAKRRDVKTKERKEQEGTSDAEEEDIEELDIEIEEEEDILKNSQHVVEKFLQYVPQFTPYFESDLYFFVGQMVAKNDGVINSIGLSFIASYVEFSANKSALGHLGGVIPSILGYTQSLCPDAVHNAFNCIRVILNTLAQVPIENNTTTFVNSAKQSIIAFLQSPKAREHRFRGSTNNACSASMSIIQLFSQYVQDLQSVLFSVLSHLPLSNADEVEAKNVHAALVQMIQGNNPLVNQTIRNSIVSKVKDAAPDCLAWETVEALQAL